MLSLLASAAAGPPTGAFADTYPSRPIHLVVAFTPGAASDIIGRLFAQGAGPLVGQQIVVENKPGAGSIIAAQYVARAAKDGYVLFLPALSTLTNQIINPAPALDLNRDFAPIALLAIGAVVLVVNPASNVHSVRRGRRSKQLPPRPTRRCTRRRLRSCCASRPTTSSMRPR